MNITTGTNNIETKGAVTWPQWISGIGGELDKRDKNEIIIE